MVDANQDHRILALVYHISRCVAFPNLASIACISHYIMWPSKHHKSKAVADYTQRLSHRPSITWNPPSLRNDQFGLVPSPLWESLDFDDGLVPKFSSEGTADAGRFRLSQRKPILTEDDDDNSSVDEKVAVEDADDEEVVRTMSAEQRKNWYKGALEALADTGTGQSGSLFRNLPVEVRFPSPRAFLYQSS